MNRKGFTLIELLIVVVIIGILAAIAIPRFGETRQRAYVSAMQSDLNQLRTAMEMYYQDNDFTYDGAAVEDLITLSPGVGVETDVDGDQTSWSAALNHDAYPDATCSYDSAVGSIGCDLP